MLASILKTATFRQSAITISGTIITGFLGALFFIILARSLGPADFGLLMIAVTTAVLIADITDLGINTGVVRFVSKALASSKGDAFEYLKLGLIVKLLVWVVVLAGGLLLAPFASIYLFNKSELIEPLKISLIGVGGISLLFISVATLQAFQRFFVYSLIQVFTNLVRILGLSLLIYAGILSLKSSILIYALVPFFGFFMALTFLPIKKIFVAKWNFKKLQDMFSFNKWVACFTIIAAISSKMDTFLNAKLLSSFDVGVYAAANQLVVIVPQIISGLGAVVAPKFASFQDKNIMLAFFRKLQLFVFGICAIGLLVIPFSFYIIPLIYGTEYQNSASIFIILFLAMLIFLISLPVHTSIIYYFSRPDVFVWVSVGHLIIMFGVGFVMIANFGILGTAITVLIGNLFVFIVPLGWFLKRIRK